MQLATMDFLPWNGFPLKARIVGGQCPTTVCPTQWRARRRSAADATTVIGCSLYEQPQRRADRDETAQGEEQAAQPPRVAGCRLGPGEIGRVRLALRGDGVGRRTGLAPTAGSAAVTTATIGSAMLRSSHKAAKLVDALAPADTGAGGTAGPGPMSRGDADATSGGSAVVAAGGAAAPAAPAVATTLAGRARAARSRCADFRALRLCVRAGRSPWARSCTVRTRRTVRGSGLAAR